MRTTEPTSEELVALSTRLAKRLRTMFTEELGPVGLTPWQSFAMLILARAGRPLRIADLAAELGIVRRSATDVADALERAGLVARRGCVDDRRAVLLEFTDAGRQMAGRLTGIVDSVGDRLFRRLGSEDRRTLAALLTVLVGDEAPPYAC